MKDNISFKGDRNLWIDFMSCIRKQRKEVWEVLSKLIRDYIKKYG